MRFDWIRRLRTSVGSSTVGTVIALPPWRLAPRLGLRQRVVSTAVFSAVLVMVCTAASPSLFLSSASSATLQRLISARCPDAAYPAVRAALAGPGPVVANLTDIRRAEALQQRSVNTAVALDRRMPAVFAAHGLPAPERVWIDARLASPTLPGPRAELRDVTWMYRTGALARVKPIAQRPGRDGIWIQQSSAIAAGLRLGSSVPVGTQRLAVTGIFRDINGSDPGPFWCAQTNLFSATSVNQDSVPQLVLLTSPSAFLATQGFTQSLTLDWWSPVNTHGLTLSEARDINAEAAMSVATLKRSPAQHRHDNVAVAAQAGGSQNSLPDMAARAALVRRGLVAPVVPIGIAGSLIALLLVTACGGLWADRRSREVTLLLARGISAPALGLKAMLELLIPALTGVVAGWVAAVGLVRAIGPSSALDANAPRQAAVVSSLAGIIVFAALSSAGAVRARRVFERIGGRRRVRYPRWHGNLPRSCWPG